MHIHIRLADGFEPRIFSRRHIDDIRFALFDERSDIPHAFALRAKGLVFFHQVCVHIRKLHEDTFCLAVNTVKIVKKQNAAGEIVRNKRRLEHHRQKGIRIVKIAVRLHFRHDLFRERLVILFFQIRKQFILCVL